MKRNVKGILLLTLMSVIMFSCVSPRVVEDLKTKKARCEEDRDKLKSSNEEFTTQNNELTANVEKLDKFVKELRRDTTNKGREIKEFIRNKNFLTDQYEMIYKNYERLKADNEDLSRKLSSRLISSEDNLLKKEDELRKLERTLQEERNKLDALKLELERREAELADKNSLLEAKMARINELQSILNRKDSVLLALKNKISDALTGFEGDGLTITQKNGKVYVSLDEQLLFKKGSSTIGSKGVKAIKKLAKVLEKNEDININIEGHTDVTGDKELNWKLSTKRALAIVNIITKNSEVAPIRLTASGRGQFLPIDNGNSESAYKKNRRTEIILTPDLDELFKLLE